MGNVIRVQHLNYTYPEAKQQALTDVSFDVAKGEWLAIIGHNGSGKSTLAKNLNGLLAPESGTVQVAGMTLSEETVWDIRAKVGIVFQNPDNQFVGATVADDVAFGLENRGVPRPEMIKRVDEALCWHDGFCRSGTGTVVWRSKTAGCHRWHRGSATGNYYFR